MQSIRKRFSLLQVISLAAIAALSLAVGVTEVQAGATLVLNVDVDEDSFRLVNEVIPGPFNVVGDTGSGPGTFQCWGWINEDLSANVSQSFNVEDRGAIMTQGPEGGSLL